MARLFVIQDAQGSKGPQKSLLALVWSEDIDLDDDMLDSVADLEVGDEISFDGRLTIVREE